MDEYERAQKFEKQQREKREAAEEARRECAQWVTQARQRGTYDARFEAIVAFSYTAAIVARDLEEAGPKADETELLILESLKSAAPELDERIEQALAVRGYVATFMYWCTAEGMGLDDFDAPLGTRDVLKTKAARDAFDRTAKMLAASVLDLPRALIAREYANCVVTGIEFEPNLESGGHVIEEDRDEQRYMVTLQSVDEDAFGDITIGVVGEEQLARFKFGSRVIVHVAPEETDGRIERIVRYRKADKEITNADLEEMNKAIDAIPNERVRAVINSALRLADEEGSNVR